MWGSSAEIYGAYQELQGSFAEIYGSFVDIYGFLCVDNQISEDNEDHRVYLYFSGSSAEM